MIDHVSILRQKMRYSKEVEYTQLEINVCAAADLLLTRHLSSYRVAYTAVVQHTDRNRHNNFYTKKGITYVLHLPNSQEGTHLRILATHKTK